jgi:hypothetical protein
MHVNGDLRKIMAALVTAGILGSWSFAATRASSDDIEAVRDEIKEVEAEAKERHAKLAKNVEDIKKTIQLEAVAAAAFRAQVRSALDIHE